MDENRQRIQLLRGYSNVDHTQLKDGEIVLHKDGNAHRDTLVAYNSDNGLSAFPSLVTVQDKLKLYEKQNYLGSERNPVTVASFQDNRLKLGSSMLIDPCFPTRNSFLNEHLLDGTILFEIPQRNFTYDGGEIVVNLEEARQLAKILLGEEHVPSSVNIVLQVVFPRYNGRKLEIEVQSDDWTIAGFGIDEFNINVGDRAKAYFAISVSNILDSMPSDSTSLVEPFIISSISNTGEVRIERQLSQEVHVVRGGLVYDTTTHSKMYPNKSQELSPLPYRLTFNEFVDMVCRLDYDVWWKVITRPGIQNNYGEKDMCNRMGWKRFLKKRIKYTQNLNDAFKDKAMTQLKREIEHVNGNTTLPSMEASIATYLSSILWGKKKQIYNKEAISGRTDGKCIKRYIDFAIFENAANNKTPVTRYTKPKGAIYRLSVIWYPGSSEISDGAYSLQEKLTYQGEINVKFLNKNPHFIAYNHIY